MQSLALVSEIHLIHFLGILWVNRFDLYSATAIEGFDHPSYQTFLEGYGIYAKGFWKRECYCLMPTPLPNFGMDFYSIHLSIEFNFYLLRL